MRTGRKRRRSGGRRVNASQAHPSVETLEGRQLLAKFTDLAIDNIALPPNQMQMGLETLMIPVQNNGPADAMGVTVHDLLPSGVLYVTSDPGGFYDPTSHTVNFNNLMISAGQKLMLSVIVRPMASGTMVNRVAVGSMMPDPDESNNTAMATFDVLGGEQLPKADVALSASLMPNPPHAAEETTLTLTVTNNGPADAHGVSVVSAVPGLFQVDSAPGAVLDTMNGLATFQLGTLASGQSQTLQITGRPLFPAMSPLVLRSLVRADEQDPNPMNNIAMVQTTVMPTPSVSGVAMTGVPGQPTHLLVNFSSEVSAGLAQNLGNYTLLDPGRDGRFDTADDRVIPLVGAAYDPTRSLVILVPSQILGRHREYRLIINGRPPQGIANGIGVPIEGNIDHRMGGVDIQTITPWSYAGPNQETLGVDRLVNLLGGAVLRGPSGIRTPTRPLPYGNRPVHIPPAPVRRVVPTPRYLTGVNPPPRGALRSRG